MWWRRKRGREGRGQVDKGLEDGGGVDGLCNGVGGEGEGALGKAVKKEVAGCGDVKSDGSRRSWRQVRTLC